MVGSVLSTTPRLIRITKLNDLALHGFVSLLRGRIEERSGIGSRDSLA